MASMLDRVGRETSGKRFLYIGLVLAVLLSGTTAPLAQASTVVANLTPNGPPSVETHKPYTVGPWTATLEGFLTDMGTATTVDLSFEWGTDTSYGNTTAPMSTVGCFMYCHAQISGLTPGTEYHYRAKAVGDGIGYGDDVAFIATMSPAVATSAATPVSTTVATLNGNLISFGTSYIVEVLFEWGLTTSYGQQTWWQEATTIGTFSATLTGLTASTTYHYRAKAEGNDGESYGEDMTFTTSAFGVPEVITTGRGPPPVSATSAALDGRLISLGSASSVTVSLVWGTTPGGPYPEETTGEVRTTTGDFCAIVSGLTPGTAYYYKAKVAGDGTSYGSERSYITKYPAKPPSVTTEPPDNIGVTTARINMSCTSFGSALGVSLYFEWGLTTSYGNTTAPNTPYGPTTLSHPLAGLAPDTIYHFRAVAVGDGIGYGYDVSFRTNSATPSVYTSAATTVTFVSAWLNGSLSNLGMATTVHVSFEYGTVSESYNSETTLQAYTSTGVFLAYISALPGTTYYYRAKALAAGIGTFYGDEMTFTTETVPPGSNCWAVIVGVADYQYSSPFEGDLTYTDDDARELYDALSPIWGSSHVKLLLNAQGTKAGIQSAISSWLDPLEDADDTILFFFSGHGGYADYDQVPVDEIDGRDEYIVPYDASDDESMIFDDQLNTWLSELESTRQVVIIDSCYSGGFIGGDFTRDLSRSGRVVIAATEEDEVGWETSALSHSVFRYYLLDGLEHLDLLDANGNNEVSAEELFAYAQPRTTEYESTHDFESIQHPEMYDGYSGELALVELATLTIDVNPRITSITLDGRVYSTSDLPVSVDFLPGTDRTFAFSVPTTIGGEVQQPRYSFVSWDDALTSATRTVTISESASFVAEYGKQYYLTVGSDSGDSNGQGWYDSGTQVSLSADTTPEGSPGMRHLFLTWSVDGQPVSGNPISVKMDSAHVVTALRTTQYEVIVLSGIGEIQGGGWYDAGSEATISVEASSGYMVRRVFAGWRGDSSAKKRNTTILVDGPKTLEASWRTDYSRLYSLILGIMIAAILAGVVLLWRTRRGSHRLPERVSDGFAP